ncbi:hypothetical protein TNCV_1160871 [Trichonephila clavipes]|nr:hypothetical protein TNCV_1160871 [Trichonephila clavipes]
MFKMTRSVAKSPHVSEQCDINIHSLTVECPKALRHELRNPHDPGNYSNDWLDQSAASYMLAGYSPQSFHIYFSDMGWRLASRAICPENVTVVTSRIILFMRHGRRQSLCAKSFTVPRSRPW